MPQLTQGLIVAVLIGLLLAVIVGYYLRQGQVNELTEALQQSQKRQEDLELEHEQRLRDATRQLQKDYEAQLAEGMERYQAQLDEQRQQLEAEYQARQSLVGGAPQATDSIGIDQSSVEPRIRKQYEARLREVAAKMQQAYEQHLQEKLAEVRTTAQHDYEQRLAETIAHYQDQASQAPQPSYIDLGDLVPEQPVASIATAANLAELEAQLQAEYDQRLATRIAQYQDEVAQRMAQLEQDYETRLNMVSPTAAVDQPSTAELELNLRRELEDSLRVEYEQKLAEKIEHYQNQLTQRTQDLEQSYEARLQLLQTGATVGSPAPTTDEVEFDLEDAIAAANAAALSASNETGLDMDAFASDTEDSSDNLELAALLNDEMESNVAEDSGTGTDPSTFDTEDGLDLDTDFNHEIEDGLDLGTDFNSETSETDLDLEALLNAPSPEPDSDDRLDSLDDISDLSS